MGGGASARRYLGGMKPEKYFRTVCWVELEETLTILGFSYDNAMNIFEAFIEIDADNSAEMSVDEFHKYLGQDVTKFSERVFGILDTDGSGMLNFKEFAVGVWNYCTYDEHLITKFAFDIFDVDHMGKLDLAECDVLVRMVYNCNRADPEIMAKIDANKDGEITIDEFSELVATDRYILQPAFDLQKAIRMRMLGVKYWETETQKRRVWFSGFDSTQQNSWESIKEILLIKQKERLEQKEHEEDLEKAEEDEKMQAIQERARREQAERQARKDKRVRALKEQESEEDRQEQAAVKHLQDARTEMELDLSFYELHLRADARRVLWESTHSYITKARAARKRREATSLKRAVGGDSEAKADEYINTKEGSEKLRHEVMVIYGKQVHDKLGDGNQVQVAVAPLFEPKVEGKVTPATKLTVEMSSVSALAAAREQARKLLIEDFRQQEQSDLAAALEKQAKDQEDGFEKLIRDITGAYGTAETRWEKLWDEQYEMHYYYNWQTTVSYWEQPAICERCDNFIDPMDVRCFVCGTERSEANLKLYHGLSALGEPVDDDDGEDDPDAG